MLNLKIKNFNYISLLDFICFNKDNNIDRIDNINMINTVDKSSLKKLKIEIEVNMNIFFLSFFRELLEAK
jgi:hypothetical protein